MTLITKENNIDKSKISIYQKGNGYLIKNGVLENKYLSLYGWSCFVFEYNKTKISNFCYFKKNMRNVNNHIFYVTKNNGKIKINLKIKGVDSLSNIYYKLPD